MTIDSIGSAGSARSPERAVMGAEAAMLQGAGRVPATTLETAAAVKAESPVPTSEQLNDAVSQMNQSPQAKAQGLEFSIDKDSQRTVVKVVDQATKEVLRQIPSPEALELARSLGANKGLLIQQTA